LETQADRILIVDDEESMREFLSIMLHREGYQVESVQDGSQAIARLRDQAFDLIITDIQMPRVDGFGLLDHVLESCPETAIIMVTAFSTTEQAVEAMKLGAYDYITKPFKNDEIKLIVRNALERKTLRRENQELRKELGQRYSFGQLIGKSKAMREVYDLVEKVASSKANVLLTGESGTGKEMVAKAVHYNSQRAEKPFIPINCGAIPENLLESELFGHEKGSFTGAIQKKEGLFEVADGGTLFLDEIGELPPIMQVKLLRVLQDQELRRVGGTKNIHVDVRVIAATNKNLEDEVAEGHFREDLYYRLNVIRIALPPLRRRREDIPMLIEHFFEKFIADRNMSVAEDAMVQLLDYHWPGNVRELENVIERCSVLGHQEQLTLDCLPDQVKRRPSDAAAGMIELPDSGFDLDEHLATIEKDILIRALEKNGGVRKKAAEYLNISFRSIRYRLSKFGLAEDEDADGNGTV
jgi:two-component system response regulator PilR (NtrC family)